MIVLSVKPSLLYLIGDPGDLALAWKTLSGQFQKKAWAYKLSFKKEKLYSLKLKEGDSVHNHIKLMTDIFEQLSVISDSIDEDWVVHLLANLQDT